MKSNWKGIILAGGKGTRLFPMTQGLNKHLLPVYDKPLIYYPLSVLMLAGIREILIISAPSDLLIFEKLLGNGSQFGVQFSYAGQSQPEGIAQALSIAREFADQSSVALILGDNIFYGQGFSALLDRIKTRKEGATILGYPVKDPQRFGIAVIDAHNQVIGLEEKPAKPQSNLAIPGLYFFDSIVFEIIKDIGKSERGEYEITDVNKHYLKNKRLHIEILGRGFTWLDAGTPESLLDAANYVHTIERRQGFKIACLEEIAYQKGWISKYSLDQIIETLAGSDYGSYLKDLTL